MVSFISRHQAGAARCGGQPTMPTRRTGWARPRPWVVLHSGVLALLWLVATLAPVRAATTVTRTVVLLAQQDATVVELAPTDNFPAGRLHAGTNEFGLILFDLSALPANATIDQALLYVQRTDGLATEFTVEAARITAAWSESDVTWDTRPGLGATGVSTTTVGGDRVEFDITSLVRNWYDGSQPNHGVGLRGDSNAVRIDSRETRPAPRLVITLTYDDVTQTPDGADAPFPDLGDAPDSSNHPGVTPNTAYVGVPGRFPTVYDTPAGQPAGPKHANLTVEGYLGDSMSREAEADVGPDQDGVNNILNGGANISDQDRGDDGWQNPNLPLPNCRQSTLTVRVHRAPSATLDRMYLNVWFDGNRDGDWEDVGQCEFDGGQQALSYEHIVQNFVVDMNAIPLGGHVDIPVTTLLVYNSAPRAVHWMRFTLSEREAPLNPGINRADGRGPHPAGPGQTLYAYGETEDLRYRPLPPIEETGTLTLTKRIIEQTPELSSLGLYTYEILLSYEGGDGPVDVQLRDDIEVPAHFHSDVEVTDVVPGVSPLTARVDLERDPSFLRGIKWVVKWDGTLAPGAQVKFLFLIHTFALCGPGQATEEVVNVAQARIVGQDLIEARATIDVPCLRTSSDVEAEQTDNYADESDLPLDRDGVDSPLRVPLRTMLTNTKDISITLAMEWLALASTGNTSGTQSIDPECRIVDLGPKETLHLDRIVDMSKVTGDWDGDGVNHFGLPDMRLQSVLSYQLVPADLNFCDVDDANNPWVAVDELEVEIRPWDVGDAPDSTNHAGVAMTAYPGVQAAFPTVFDPLTGLPQGPAHNHPLPFHLGPQVELERDADLLPAPRNIRPPTNAANRDGFDDGADPNSWTLQQCETSLINVEVFISPAAAAWFAANDSVGYLNGWIDSNRDGNWDDEFPCPASPGLQPVALEHFILDGEVDVVGLGPGLHTLTVNTGRVPWPAANVEMPAWVRLTLSERPANKTLASQIVDGLTYGDGRGYTDAHETGETEDYLLYPNTATGGQPDLDLDVRFRWRPTLLEDAGDGTLQAASPQIMDEIDLFLQIDYRNQGDAPAENARLSLDLSEIAGIQSTDWDFLIAGKRYTPEDLTQIALGTVQPGEGNRIIAILEGITANGGTTAQSVDARTFTGGVRVAITADNEDANPADNNVDQTIDARFPPRILGFTGGVRVAVGDYKAGGVTCSDDVTLFGIGMPNSKVRVYDHFRPEIGDEVVVDADGEWRLSLSGLADGSYRWLVEPVQTGAAGLAAAGSLADHRESPALVFTVDSSLSVDASSFVFGDGSVRFRFSSNHPSIWNNGDGSDIVGDGDGSDVFNAIAGRSYELAVNACSAPASVEVQMVNEDGSETLLAQLTDPDGDLRYTAPFSVPPTSGVQSGQVQAANWDGTSQLILRVTDKSGEQQTFQTPVRLGKRARVVDAITGEPIEGAKVTLLGAWTDMRPHSYEEIKWTFKSANPASQPQITDANGEYTLVTPDLDRYALLVMADGYQPYRSPTRFCNGYIDHATELIPLPRFEPELTITLDHGGFTPAYTSWGLTCTSAIVNNTLFDLEFDVELESKVQSAAGDQSSIQFSSGRLAPGESLLLEWGPDTVATLTDRSDPATRAPYNLLDDPIADRGQLFLPTISP